MTSLREKRELLGLTQQALADKIGVSKNQVSMMERGKVLLPEPETRRALARTLNIRHIDVLVGLGVLEEWEVPGFNGTEPAPDPELVARHTLLDQIDLKRDNRGTTLDVVLKGWADQDRQQSARPERHSGTH